MNDLYRDKKERMKKNEERTIITSIATYVETYCRNSSVHGFNHIAAPRRHWSERLLWVVVTTVAVWGVVDISLGQWQRYNDNPTVVTLEKDFRTWRYNLPAITACERDRVSTDKLANAIKSRWNVSPGQENFEYYKKFVQTVANSDLYNLTGYEDFKEDPNLNVDLFELIVEVMPDYNRIKIGSSETLQAKWTPVMTELGACHTINSIAILDVSVIKSDWNATVAPISCRYSTQSCYWILECSHVIDYYIHSPYDVANIMLPPSTTYASLNRFSELTTMETRAGPGVRELPPRTRHCLYTSESTRNSRKVYSTNICRQDCRGRLAMRLCGCLPFYYFYDGYTKLSCSLSIYCYSGNPSDGPPCTPAGMWCLSRYSHRLATFDSVKCICSQQCLDSVFREVSKEEQIWDRGPFQARGAVRLTVRPPRARYSRYIVFHLQDLIVSFGGAAGLFLGASFISFVEIAYFILEGLFRCRRVDTKVSVQKPLPYENRVKELNNIIKEL